MRLTPLNRHLLRSPRDEMSVSSGYKYRYVNIYESITCKELELLEVAFCIVYQYDP